MTTISYLSDDLIGEILSRVPITSLSALRSTCRRWNYLSKTHVFGKKAARNQQFLGFMLINCRVFSLRFNFQGIHSNDEIFIDSSVEKVRELENVFVSRIFQCDGLLLCDSDVTEDHPDHLWLLVWNPYLGETRWILQPSRNSLMGYNSYAFGYYNDNKNNRNYKILRFLYDHCEAKQRKYQIEVYDFSSNSWRVLDVSTDSEEPHYHTGVSLKGNTYFLGRKVTHTEDHLLCFNFTTEKFGQHLPLPPLDYTLDSVTLSCLRDEKLALLRNYYGTLETIKIWISTKIEPNAVSWSVFFKVNRNNLPWDYFGNISFFIDEEKKVAVLSHKRACVKGNQRLCIIGEDRFIKYENIGEGMKNHWDYSNLLNSSYVPSLVQLKLNQSSRKRKQMED